MTNTPMRSRTTLKSWPGAVFQTDVPEMIISSVGGARYFFFRRSVWVCEVVPFEDQRRGNRVFESTSALV